MYVKTLSSVPPISEPLESVVLHLNCDLLDLFLSTDRPRPLSGSLEAAATGGRPTDRPGGGCKKPLTLVAHFGIKPNFEGVFMNAR